jgi:hypothetical protein
MPEKVDEASTQHWWGDPVVVRPDQLVERCGGGPMRSAVIALLCAVSLSACATVPPGPSVTVMPERGKSFEGFQGDDAACRQWASQQAGIAPEAAAETSTVESAALGTLLGAGLGAAIGAAAGDPGIGAAIGAGGGLVTGTVIGADRGQAAGQAVQRRFDTAYEQCMYAKGNHVPTAVAPPLAAIYPGVPPPPPPGVPVAP